MVEGIMYPDIPLPPVPPPPPAVPVPLPPGPPVPPGPTPVIEVRRLVAVYVPELVKSWQLVLKLGVEGGVACA